MDRIWARGVPAGDCILYKGRITQSSISSGTGRNISVSRAAYILTHGPIPDGKVVCHTCDHPGCINPKHLWLGTYAQNIHDMDEKGRRGYPLQVTFAQLRKMKRLHKKGSKPKDLAEKFHLPIRSVYNLLNSSMWNWLV